MVESVDAMSLFDGKLIEIERVLVSEADFQLLHISFMRHMDK